MRTASDLARIFGDRAPLETQGGASAAAARSRS